MIGLRSESLEVEVIPSLGARIFSIADRASGKNWLWRPNDGRGLFASQFGDEYPHSPITGAEECIPTIQPCSWKHRELPDHGEVWALPWEVNERDLAAGRITTEIELPISPFVFTRTIELRDNRLILDYTLTNHGNSEEEYLWSWHPLFCFEPGDRIELSPELTELKVDEGKNPDIERGEICPISSLEELASNTGGSLKCFASAASGVTSLIDGKTGAKLTIQWDPALLPWLGIWMNRGAWNGFHHIALEPTNGAPDALDIAVEDWDSFAVIQPGETTRWQVRVTCSPGS